MYWDSTESILEKFITQANKFLSYKLRVKKLGKKELKKKMASLIKVVVSIWFMIQEVRRLVISQFQPALLHLSPPLGATNKTKQ